MTTQDLFLEMKPYIQPFERLLALQELRVLAHSEPVPHSQAEADTPTLYEIATDVSPDFLASRLTYWETVRGDGAIAPRFITQQVRYEATSDVARNGGWIEALPEMLPFNGHVPLPRRRTLRYGSHGIHEYRGKFFPQLVRSLLNIGGANTETVVLDPMCGSGTTLVEASILGCNSFGLDMNPLSVLMSQAKTEILAIAPSVVLNEYKRLELDVLTAARKGNLSHQLIWFDHLPSRDQEYLSLWFAPEVLTQLDPIMTRIQQVEPSACRKLFLIALSNILRGVSWQKDDDLRVRKQDKLTADFDVPRLFLDELEGSLKSVLSFLFEKNGRSVGKSQVIGADARCAAETLPNQVGNVDMVITSPPYATALPYLDTDRLSLCYLNLLSRPEHRSRDYHMIGNREITERYRQSYLDAYRREQSTLPESIVTVIDHIHTLNENGEVGFRRRNLSALLAKYFLDMKSVFENLHTLVRPGGTVYVVIWNNHTIAGGERVDIETDTLLAQLGQNVGFILEETISMEMLVSRDIFKKNASSAETILNFRRQS
jgi:SAM-dependent methyltransferase